MLVDVRVVYKELVTVHALYFFRKWKSWQTSREGERETQLVFCLSFSLSSFLRSLLLPTYHTRELKVPPVFLPPSHGAKITFLRAFQGQGEAKNTKAQFLLPLPPRNQRKKNVFLIWTKKKACSHHGKFSYEENPSSSPLQHPLISFFSPIVFLLLLLLPLFLFKLSLHNCNYDLLPSPLSPNLKKTIQPDWLSPLPPLFVTIPTRHFSCHAKPKYITHGVECLSHSNSNILSESTKSVKNEHCSFYLK